MVPISLMELFQISPDLSKAFRKLSTRVNEKKSKSKAHGEATQQQVAAALQQGRDPIALTERTNLTST